MRPMIFLLAALLCSIPFSSASGRLLSSVQDTDVKQELRGALLEGAITGEDCPPLEGGVLEIECNCVCPMSGGPQDTTEDTTGTMTEENNRIAMIDEDDQEDKEKAKVEIMQANMRGEELLTKEELQAKGEVKQECPQEPPRIARAICNCRCSGSPPIVTEDKGEKVDEKAGMRDDKKDGKGLREVLDEGAQIVKNKFPVVPEVVIGYVVGEIVDLVEASDDISISTVEQAVEVMEGILSQISTRDAKKGAEMAAQEDNKKEEGKGLREVLDEGAQVIRDQLPLVPEVVIGYVKGQVVDLVEAQGDISISTVEQAVQIMENIISRIT